MLRRFAIPVLIGAVALTAPGVALAKWGTNSTGTGYGQTVGAPVAPTSVTATANVNSQGNTAVGSARCVSGQGIHRAYVKISWSGPSTSYAGETYTINWSEQTGSNGGASGSATGATGSPTVVNVLSSNNSVSYTFTVTSVLGTWTADSTATAAVSTANC